MGVGVGVGLEPPLVPASTAACGSAMGRGLKDTCLRPALSPPPPPAMSASSAARFCAGATCAVLVGLSPSRPSLMSKPSLRGLGLESVVSGQGQG